MKLNNLVKTNTSRLSGRELVLERKTSGRGVKGQKSRSGVAIKSFEEAKPLYVTKVLTGKQRPYCNNKFRRY